LPPYRFANNTPIESVVRYDISQSGNVLRVDLYGEFGQNALHVFPEVIRKAIKTGDFVTIEVHLSQVDDIDSHAIGMLLLLSEKAQAVGRTVSICGATGAVREVLDAFNLSDVFPIK
jgi:anti-anti-sigma factor